MFGDYGTDNPFGPPPPSRATRTPLRQPGFVVYTTAEFSQAVDADTGLVTGYAWSRYELDGTLGQVSTPPDNQWTGKSAFDLLNRTDIPAGTVCWCEPAPSHGGWLIIPILGAGSGSGSGSGEPCEEPVEPVEVNCDDGERTLTIHSLGVTTDGNSLVLEVCESNDVPLGPCSPVNPRGKTLPVATQVCPILGFVKVVDADYTISYEDDIVHGDGTDITIKMPLIGGGSGPGADQFWVKNVNASSLTLDGNGADIEGDATKTLVYREGMILYSDGVHWRIIAGWKP